MFIKKGKRFYKINLLILNEGYLIFLDIGWEVRKIMIL